MYRTGPNEQPSAAAELRLPGEDQAWASADDAGDPGPLPGIEWTPADEAGAARRPSSQPRHRHRRRKSRKGPTVAALATAVAGLGIVPLLIAVSNRDTTDQGTAPRGPSTPTSLATNAHSRGVIPNPAPAQGHPPGPSGSAPSRSAPTRTPQPAGAVSTSGPTQQPGVAGSTVTAPAPTATGPARATKHPNHGKGHRCVRTCG